MALPGSYTLVLYRTPGTVSAASWRTEPANPPIIKLQGDDVLCVLKWAVIYTGTIKSYHLLVMKGKN